MLQLIFSKLASEKITIELKSGLIVCGILLKSDKNMNIHLKKAKKINQLGFSFKMKNIFIRGNTIKYMALPMWINFDFFFYMISRRKKIQISGDIPK